MPVCTTEMTAFTRTHTYFKNLNDDKGIIRTILIYPLNIGRFIPEIIRIVQALQMAECARGSTPAN